MLHSESQRPMRIDGLGRANVRLADQMTPPGGSVILSRRIPRSRLVMVPDAGHNLPIEMPALFTAAILAFFGGLELASAPA